MVFSRCRPLTTLRGAERPPIINGVCAQILNSYTLMSNNERRAGTSGAMPVPSSADMRVLHDAAVMFHGRSSMFYVESKHHWTWKHLEGFDNIVSTMST